MPMHASPNVIAGDVTVIDGDVVFDNNNHGVKGTLPFSGGKRWLARLANSGDAVFGEASINPVIHTNGQFIVSPDGGNTEWMKVTTAGVKLLGEAVEIDSADQVIKAWAHVLAASAVDSYNVDSVSKDATGEWTITWTRDFADDDYVVLVGLAGAAGEVNVTGPPHTSAGSASYETRDSTGTLADRSTQVVAVGTWTP